MQRIAIVGMGPWGVCALERIVTRARRECRLGVDVAVHVIEPGPPGAGVYGAGQPDYLLLNNQCGELSLYPYEVQDDQPAYAAGLYEWAVARGYRWVGDRCRIDSAGAPLERHHFLPRRLMGEYLRWFYDALLSEAPPRLHIAHHPTAAVDVVERRDGTEEVHLASGGAIVVDDVIITSGHTANRGLAREGRMLEPYPVAAYVDALPAGATVAVAGMGLVGIDVVTALTLGRGGCFETAGDRLRYRPSGREPKLEMYCRSGLPFTAKSVTGRDRSDVYEPLIATDAAIARVTGEASGRRRAVDVRTELLPLLFGEMSARYYAQAAYQATGTAAAGAAVRERLAAAWAAGRFEREVAEFAGRHGAFDPAELFFGGLPECADGDDYERFVHDALASDLREAEVPDGASPVKSAAEVLRIFRDRTRAVVERGGLTLESHLDFNGELCGRIHRLVAGPPALRSRQMLALMDAGVVRTPYGPAPMCAAVSPRTSADAGASRISSTALARPHRRDVDVVIRGHLDEPRLAGSASPLLTALHARGRLSEMRYGQVTVSSVELTPNGHPIDVHGRAQAHLSVFGVLTEGARHFTQYIPSPRSRIRAFEEIGARVDEILAGAQAGAGAGEQIAA